MYLKYKSLKYGNECYVNNEVKYENEHELNVSISVYGVKIQKKSFD